MDIVGMYKFLTGKAEALFPGGLGYLDDLLKFWKDSEAALKASQGKDKPRKLVLPEKEDRHNLYKAQVDALQRVGGYIFGSPAQVLMGRQNRQLEKIEARLVEIKTSITGQLSN
jgi:hypothetical protein